MSRIPDRLRDESGRLRLPLFDRQRFYGWIEERPDGCHEWRGCRNGQNYGLFSLLGKSTPAHRLAYELKVGRIGDDKIVGHLCDRPWCVNPEHLFACTGEDNIRDRTSKGRSRGRSFIGDPNIRKAKDYQPKILTDEERFLIRVDRTGDCWLWIGPVHLNGYGVFYSRTGLSNKAHRASYQLFIGNIPPGMFVCHTCDNPPCVNPAHLFAGTHGDNMRDMIRKGRQRILSGDEHPWRKHPEFIPRGERNGMRKHPERHTRGENNHFSHLKSAQVLDLLERYGQGVSPTAIASDFNVSPSHVHGIANGSAWSGVSAEIDDARTLAQTNRRRSAKVRIEAMLHRRSEGVDVMQLSKEFNMSTDTIRRILNGELHQDVMAAYPGETLKDLRSLPRPPRPGPTHCKWGHPFSGDNLSVHAKTNRRSCKACARRWTHEYRQRTSAARHPS